MNRTEWRKHHIWKRILSLVLTAALLLTFTAFPEKTEATEPSNWNMDQTTTARNLVISLVRKNVQICSGGSADEQKDLSALTDDAIIGIFENNHLETTDWSTVILHTVVEQAVGAARDLLGDEAIVVDNAKLQSYTGSAMPLNYSMGDLMVDWARQNVPVAAVVDDSTIRQFYDQTVQETGGSPYVLLKNFGQKVMDQAESYASQNSVGDNKIPMVNTENFITYRQWVQQGNIASSGTLFIGTWMLDAQSVNSTLYNKAVRSMAEDDQQIMYYKSELAGGRWRDIASASSLNAILPAGDDVPDTELLDYYISVIVGRDGIPRSAKTGEYVDIFKISDPYKIEELPEIRPIKLLLEAGNLKPYVRGGRGSDAYVYDRVKMFFLHDQPYPHTDMMEFAVNWWKEANRRNNTYGKIFPAWDPNSPLEYKHRDWGWRRSTWGGVFTWWSDDEWYATYSKQYSGDAAVLDMLQSIAEYGHQVEIYMDRQTYYYRYFSSGNLFNDYFWNPWPFTQVYETINPGEPANTFFGRAYKSRIQMVEYPNAKFDVLQNLDQNRLNLFVDLFKQFWNGSSSIRDAETDHYDAQLTALENLYLPLKRAGHDEEADRAMLLQEQIDAARRSRAYYNLAMNDEHNYGVGAPLNNLYSQVAFGTSDFGRSYPVMSQDYGEEGGDFRPDNSMMDAVGNAVLHANETYNNYNDLALHSGETVAETFEFDTSQEIIQNAAQGAEAMMPRLQQLTDLDNILESTVVHKARELQTLETLQMTSDARITEEAHEVANEEYQTAANDPETSQETLRKILQTQKAGLSATIGEAQQFIKARVIRLGKQDSLDYIDTRIDWAEARKPGVSADAYGPYELEAIDAHIEWLKNLKKSVLGMLGLEDEGPEEDKAALNQERLDLLDNGDLDGLDDKDKQIDDADKEKELKRQRNLAILDGTGDASDKVDAELDLTDIDAAKRDLLEDAEKKVEGDDPDRLPEIVEALGDLGVNMDDLIGKMKKADLPKSVIRTAIDANERGKTSPFRDDLDLNDGPDGEGDDNNGNGPYDGDGSGTGGNNGPGPGDGDGNNGRGSVTGNNGPNGPGGNGDDGSGDNGDGPDGGGDGNGGAGGTGNGNGAGVSGLTGGGGSGNGSGLDGDDINGAIEDAFGDQFGNLSDSDKATVTAALNKFADNRDDDELRKRVKDLLNQLLAEGNGFIYRQYLADPSQKYVSLGAVDKCRPLTKARCVTIGDKATMSQIAGGSASYVFTIGGTTVENNMGKTSEMTTPTVTQSDPSIWGSRTAKYPYITEESSSRYLQDTCEYIPDTEWAILIAPSMSKKVVELLEVLDELADEE